MSAASPDPPTMAAVLQAQAARIPDQLAFCFLIDGEDEGPRLSFADLDRRARALAVALRDLAAPGDRALLLYPPGLEFVPAFFGCLYAGVLPVPVYPPRLERLDEGWLPLVAVARDCEPRAVLTDRTLAAFLGGAAAPAPLGELPWVVTDAVDLAAAGRWREPTVAENATAFIQYTSGSTAAPRGVAVTHRNLMFTERLIQTALEHRGDRLGVCWLPLYHDLGLIGGALQAVYHGGPCVLMSPLSFLQKPARWLRAVARYRADTSGGPNFAFDLCAQRVAPDEVAGIDLSNWSVAAVGAEPVREATLRRFADTFAPQGFRYEAFYPCYGLAEATVFVTGGPKGDPPVVRHLSAEALERGRVVAAPAGQAGTRTVVACGRTWLGQRVVLADPEALIKRPPGEVGEIWVEGPAVASGYWGRPEDTARTFGARLRDTGEGPFLRTGDLGFVEAEQLFVTGRLKDVIVVRGRNHDPQEIEDTAQAAHPLLRPGCGAAFEAGADGGRLVLVQEVERRARGLDASEVIGAIRQAIAERHDLQVHEVVLLQSGSIPKTSSGKVQRHRCRADYERGALRRWKGAGR